ncbi:far1-related sequence 3 -like protein [Gossypium arboreum]|uniref:Protein FAR1-RELATED SEQUENCE n=1 Tax=Gossypium arboreum TaxID=29729 RepID=A0A0B0MH96_GOSAR|nr:far1-related sequence 3 -like protein [Gossypium arboreum]
MDVGGEKGDDVNGVNAESNKGGDNNWNLIENLTEIEVVSNQDDDGVAGGKPCLGMEFESEDAGKTFYDGYARLLGFSTHVGQFTRATPDGPIVTWDFACSREYERALEHSLEKEIEADFDTICTTPVPKTPSPMEQQAANFYTKKVFSKFQEELVETFVYTANKIEGDGIVCKYRVAKYEHEHKAYFVALNISDMKASCTCQMFEYSGILCRHILTVFTVTNVLTLPSHYILKRWTRSAKSWVGLDEQHADPQGIETLTTRFNNLCQEALKLAEEGAMAPETYNAAINALKEAGKKIASVKKNVAKVRPPSSHNSGNNHEDGCKKTTSPVSKMIPSLWPWQDAVPPHFNLNDVGAPLTDLNQPSMVPVSLHRDTGHPDSTVVLTCFKSMTWVIENKNAMEAGKVAVINLKLHDYGKNPLGETEVQFRLTRVTLEPMLRSMAYISQQLSTPLNRVAVINLKLQDTKTTSGETEVKFQVSKDTLGSMLRSMAYIREQL